jgi:23S rRNA (cytosine1962-C5)-methyltransferase
VNALIGNASKVTSIESSRDAVDIAKENIALNQLDDQKCEWILGDVFQELRGMRDRDLKFDVIIMDPPKFAPTKAQISAASRGYKDINLLAFKLLNPGGILFTFSCSGGIKRDLFQKIVADAALDAGVRASILEYLSQDKDHPVALNFPESEYLKGLVCRII